MPSAQRSLLGLLPALALFAPAPSAAQTETPEVVVTATRVATPVSRVAGTIAVITAADIARKQYRTIDEALRSEPSLQISRSGGPGKLSSIFSRGTNANHTLVLLDGIELNDPSTTDGRVDLGSFALDDVERIEVLYGSQGTLYGSDAIGAVINVVTKTGKGPPTGSVQLEGGSFGTFNQAASLRGGADTVNYALNVQHLRTTGISATPSRFAPPGESNDHDTFDNVTVGTKLGWQATETLSFGLVGRYSRTANDLDLNVFPIQSDNDSRTTGEQYAVRGEGKLVAFGGRTEHRLGIAYTRYDRHDRDDRDPINAFDFLRDDNVGTKLKFDLQNDVRVLPGHVFTLGLETEKETIDSALTSDSLFGPFSSSADAGARNNAVYLQDQFEVGYGLFGALGVRVDDHENFGTEPTWRAALGWRSAETGTTVRGSYATGFKAPSLYQLYGSSISGFGVFTGNPNLQPEESRTWEAGVEQRLFGGRLTLGATYFDTEVENLIQGGATTNVNVGNASLTGVEASLSAEIAPEVRFGIRYTYLVPRDEDADTDLLRRARHRGYADLSIRATENLTLTPEVVYVGERLDIDAATFATIRVPGYTLVNFAASYRITDNLTGFGRLTNLLDKDYEDPDGFSQPGAGIFVGMRATY